MKKKSLFSKFLYWSLFTICVFAGVSAFSFCNTLKFAHISDVHLSDKTINTSYKLLANSKDLFDDELKQIKKAKGLDFVFVTGDMTDKPKFKLIEEFETKMNTLKTPWYSSFGNHDISIGGPVSKEKYIEILKKNNKNFKFDKPYYSFSPKKGFKIISLDGVIDNRITANGKISPEQLKWLDNELSKAQKKDELPLIFLHFPIEEPFPSFHHKILNSDDVLKILNKYKMPIAVFSGHYHVTKIIKKGNLLFVSTPSLVSYPNAFRIVTVTNLKNKVIFNFEFKETNLKELQKKAKLLTFSSKNYYGEESDRNTTVVMDK